MRERLPFLALHLLSFSEAPEMRLSHFFFRET